MKEAKQGKTSFISQLNAGLVLQGIEKFKNDKGISKEVQLQTSLPILRASSRRNSSISAEVLMAADGITVKANTSPTFQREKNAMKGRSMEDAQAKREYRRVRILHKMGSK